MRGGSAVNAPASLSFGPAFPRASGELAVAPPMSLRCFSRLRRSCVPPRRALHGRRKKPCRRRVNSTEGVSKFRCTLWLYFYKQSPDFHKPGLCHVAKFLYLCDIQ